MFIRSLQPCQGVTQRTHDARETRHSGLAAADMPVPSRYRHNYLILFIIFKCKAGILADLFTIRRGIHKYCKFTGIGHFHTKNPRAVGVGI